MSSPYDDNDNDLAPFTDGFNGDGDDSDDEMDWEEVPVAGQQPQEEQPLMKIVLRPDNEAEEPSKKKPRIMSHAERLLRIDCHKIHTVLLLVNARIRNKWLNDELLHARLLSLTPLPLQNAFAMIHSSKIPDAGIRGRMFENSVSKLAEWWSQDFFDVDDEGHIRNITFDVMNQRLAKFVDGFEEIFNLAVAPPESERDDNRLKEKGKNKGKGKEKEEPVVPSGTLIDSSNLDLLEDILDNTLEPIKSPKSLMKHALMQSGTRDVSAQLFTALCRALRIPARLVVSLQSVPWKAAVGREAKRYPKKSNDEQRKGKGKGKAKENGVADTRGETELDAAFRGIGDGHRLDDDKLMEQSEKGSAKGKGKPPVKLRKTKSKGNVLGSVASTASKVQKVKHDDPHTTPPTYWTEVFSKADSRWIPVDPIRGFVNKRHLFDPSPSSSNPNSISSSGDNRLIYVIAFEEDGYARDVTRRYAKEYSSKVAKVQGGSAINTNRARVQWWEGVMGLVTRPFRLNRDDIEDDEFETAQLMEGMPTSMTGFKDHPLYVLSRHLKQNETIYPPPAPASDLGTDSSTSRNRHGLLSYTPELGKFRGEPVYPRSSVVSLKTPENWLRTEGRSIKAGEVPMKYVKLRASTIGKKREIEMIKEEMKNAKEKTKAQAKSSGVIDIHVDELASEEQTGITEGTTVEGEVMQGLYARHQTEPYVPDPVIDGIVPKNQFGNIDLYVQSMLPKGGVHMPFKGIAKIARNLHIDYAEAVIGFEFRKRRAMPVLEGIVVAAGYEEILLEAFLEAEREAAEKNRIKKEERALKQWARLVHGLRIRQRLQEQYADRLDAETPTPTRASPKEKNKKGANIAKDKNDVNDKRRRSEPSHGVINTGGENKDQTLPETEEFDDHNFTGGAGFLVQAGDVVQPFRLPRFPKLDSDLVDHSAGRLSESKSNVDMDTGISALPAPDFETFDIGVIPMAVDGQKTVNSSLASRPATPMALPKSMHELAQAQAEISEDPHAQAPVTRFISGSETVSMSAKRSTRKSTGSEPPVVSPETGAKSPVKRKRGQARQESSHTAPAQRRSARSSTRKPKRRRKDDSDDDATESEGGDFLSSPVKHSSVASSTATNAESGTTSTRVLRPRIAKRKV
ncbi:hypothetical protein F5880DRAFT_1611580 [Lentinula raphanica]|nr:hypothetical protein F5880DRAFT_1611580 [Lentinula raphanica]